MPATVLENTTAYSTDTSVLDVVARDDELEAILRNVELVETDGEPLESHWHVLVINLLLESIECHFRERNDFYAGGNMFIYFNEEQVRNRDYRGPDFFFVSGVSRQPMRPYWVVWKEGGRYPDVIIELSSPSTRHVDLTTKKEIYQNIFRTAEYYCYDPNMKLLEGWRLANGAYEDIQPDANGRLECRTLNVLLGSWKGVFQGWDDEWLRFFYPHGHIVPVFAEAGQQQVVVERQRADAERRQAENERRQREIEQKRAEAAEAELASLKAQLASQSSSAK